MNERARTVIFTRIVYSQSRHLPVRARPEQGLTRLERRHIEWHELHCTINSAHRAIIHILKRADFENYRVAIVLWDQYHCTAVFARIMSREYLLVLFDTEYPTRFQRFNQLCEFFRKILHDGLIRGPFLTPLRLLLVGRAEPFYLWWRRLSVQQARFTKP